jgi:hypothetical protein
MADEEDVSPEELYASCEDATELWAHVREETRFTRRIGDTPETDDDYNHRLLYLLAAAVFGRVEKVANHRAFRKLLRVMADYADGKATSDQFEVAHAAADSLHTDNAPAARDAARWSIHLLLDDYKVIEGVDHVSDAAGYLAAVEAGVLKKNATIGKGQAVWKSAAFLAGKAKEERAICGIIRDIFGNPFQPAPVIAPAWLVWNENTIPKLAQTIYDERRFEALPVLADALEEAGCDNADILAHLRSSGLHVLGCWALDLVLGKH